MCESYKKKYFPNVIKLIQFKRVFQLFPRHIACQLIHLRCDSMFTQNHQQNESNFSLLVKTEPNIHFITKLILAKFAFKIVHGGAGQKLCELIKYEAKSFIYLIFNNFHPVNNLSV